MKRDALAPYVSFDAWTSQHQADEDFNAQTVEVYRSIWGVWLAWLAGGTRARRDRRCQDGQLHPAALLACPSRDLRAGMPRWPCRPQPGPGHG